MSANTLNVGYTDYPGKFAVTVRFPAPGSLERLSLKDMEHVFCAVTCAAKTTPGLVLTGHYPEKHPLFEPVITVYKDRVSGMSLHTASLHGEWPDVFNALILCVDAVHVCADQVRDILPMPCRARHKELRLFGPTGAAQACVSGLLPGLSIYKWQATTITPEMVGSCDDITSKTGAP